MAQSGGDTSATAAAPAPDVRPLATENAPPGAVVPSTPVGAAAASSPEPIASSEVAGVAVTPRAAGPDKVLASIVSTLPVPARELNVAAPRPAPVVTVKPPVADASPIEPRRERRQVATADDVPATSKALLARHAKSAGEDAKPAPRKRELAEAETPRSKGRKTTIVESDDALVAKGKRKSGAAELAADDVPPRGKRGRREVASTDDEVTLRTRHGKRDATEADDTPIKTARGKAAKKLADKDDKPTKAEAQRYWVQVAGGANDGDLGKAWSTARAKAPALAGKKGYTTPLHATNRVLAGPFKDDDEARAFVNKLKKQGVPAFQFTSAKGQKVTRLDQE